MQSIRFLPATAMADVREKAEVREEGRKPDETCGQLKIFAQSPQQRATQQKRRALHLNNGIEPACIFERV